MNTLRERMNFSSSEVEDAHVMTNVQMGFAAYDTLCLICAELNIDVTNVSDEEFDAAVSALDDFVNAANEGTGYTVSVWFDK